MIEYGSPLLGNSGTGWVYSARQGLIVTAFHVTNGTHVVAVNVGDYRWRPATVVAASPCDDLALLAVRDTRGLETMPLHPGVEFQRGAKVMSQGFGSAAGPRRWESKNGVIRNPLVAIGPAVYGFELQPFDRLLETTSITRPGFSGGPIVDGEGLLVAMTIGTNTDPDGRETTYGLRVDRIREALTAFHLGEAPGWAGSGLSFQERLGGRRRGVVVTGLAAGLRGGYAQQGVLVTAVNGASVGASYVSWCRTVGALPPGKATLTIVREPGARPTKVTLPINRARSPLPLPPTPARRPMASVPRDDRYAFAGATDRPSAARTSWAISGTRQWQRPA